MPAALFHAAAVHGVSSLQSLSLPPHSTHLVGGRSPLGLYRLVNGAPRGPPGRSREPTSGPASRRRGAIETHLAFARSVVAALRRRVCRAGLAKLALALGPGAGPSGVCVRGQSVLLSGVLQPPREPMLSWAFRSPSRRSTCLPLCGFCGPSSRWLQTAYPLLTFFGGAARARASPLVFSVLGGRRLASPEG